MNYTPMMQQYLAIKEQYKDALVFYRLGDFYEMFFDDAKIASKELELVLTGRNAGIKDKVPMCGVPHHAVNSYIKKLVEKGYKVAIAEQLEEAITGKMVERDVVKVITPGTIFNDDDTYTVNICGIYDYQYGLSMSLIDLSTGKTLVINIDNKINKVSETLLKYNVKEVVIDTLSDKFIELFNELDVLVSYSSIDENSEYLRHLKDVDDIRIINSYKILVNYLAKTQKQTLDHLQDVIVVNENKNLLLDYNTIVNLELVTPQNTQITLYRFLDKCQSSMGSRLLKDLIENPLYDLTKINERLDQITIIKDDVILQDDLKEYLNDVYDIERILAKLALKTFNPIDAIRLYKTLTVLPKIKELLLGYPQFKEVCNYDKLTSLHDLLGKSIREDASINVKDGGVFKKGYDTELDELLELSASSKQWIIAQENIEKEKTGIKNLKIGYNRVFGYYIEVSKSNISAIKDEYGYIRKQTLANQERYITNELKEKEDLILSAFDKAIRKEIFLFNELCEIISKDIISLQKLAKKLAYIDCIYALSVISSKSNYVRPMFCERDLRIVKGRHPILDDILKQQYVANDTALENDKEIMLVTGPNMGGKSTYMRQTALIVIMAQMGMYVPCKEVVMPLFDAIYTRIGANDDILSGQSTFMVEMNEANYALNNASDKSLIIFDEIGRGTSTYDGLSLAQAIVEYIANHIHAKTLFSTHYHELTSLEESHKNIINYQVKVHEEDDHVTFMYEVIKGRANKSYGINVAKLAGLPNEILQRSKSILKSLESESIQMPLFVTEGPIVYDKNEHIIKKLNEIDTNKLSPLEALLFINELKKEIK